MIDSIEKNREVEYNNIILDVNKYKIAEPGNPYGHIKEFKKLKNGIKYEAHRVISRKALELYSKGKIYGSVIDINGDMYLFEIFSDTMYRITNIIRLNDDIREVLYEKYIKKNS